LAKAAGISGPYQLAPLMLWWLMAGGALLIVSSRANSSVAKREPEGLHVFVWPKRGMIALALFVGAVAAAPMIHQAIASTRNK
jgi:hypothetical protein